LADEILNIANENEKIPTVVTFSTHFYSQIGTGKQKQKEMAAPQNFYFF
jgi:hypothetical protein